MVKSFQTKLALFAKHLFDTNFARFPLLKSWTVGNTSMQKCSGQVTALMEEFVRRFANFKAVKPQFILLRSPFTSDIETTTDELQLELIPDNALKSCLETNF